jgi:hypothetical protein
VYWGFGKGEDRARALEQSMVMFLLGIAVPFTVCRSKLFLEYVIIFNDMGYSTDVFSSF